MAADSHHAIIAHWLTQVKLAKRKREETGRAAQKWLRRVELALEAADPALAEAARAKALEVRAEYETASRHLATVEAELERARDEARRDPGARAVEFDAAQERAHHTIEEFKKMGVDPTWERLARGEKLPEKIDTGLPLTPEQEAERELDALLAGEES